MRDRELGSTNDQTGGSVSGASGVIVRNADVAISGFAPLSSIFLPEVTLADNQHGLVIGPPINIDASALWQDRPDIDAQELRFASLFWDQLVAPQNHLLRLGFGPEATFLEREGILQLAEVEMAGRWGMADALSTTFAGTLAKLIERDGRRWTLARGEKGPNVFLDDDPAPSLVFDIHKVIPVPDKDVPLEEVLEFKRRRVAELVALRARLDEALYAIAADPGTGSAAEREMKLLANAIADHLRVSREASIIFRLTGLRTKVDINFGAVTGAVTAHTMAVEYGMPPIVSELLGLTGGVLSSISFSASHQDRSSPRSNLEYVSRFHRDLFR